MAEREANGRFAKGNSASKGHSHGRPKRKREERYYDILVSTVTFDRWKRIVDKAAQQAERGDSIARKWLADYIVGVPEQTQNVNITGYPSIRDIVAELPQEDGGDE